MPAKPICVVAGGSRGMGLSMVIAFLLEIGAAVYSLDQVEPEDQNQTSKIAVSNGELTHLQTDVSDANALNARLEETFKCHQRLDCLVNNAGFFETSENNNILWNTETTTEQINFMLNTNIGSVVHGTRTAAKLMKQCPLEQNNCHKTIINIASTAAFGPFPMHPVYCSCKGAVLQFTRMAQFDLKADGFPVYAVCPGIIDTDMGRMGGEPNRCFWFLGSRGVSELNQNWWLLLY